mmetsp:Transcript_67374/g.140387  ORF Transcript_67374/g.140387 Transcript_67374/m.140387 type:complete len:215 (-) Transcript_67374:169-813(-)
MRIWWHAYNRPASPGRIQPSRACAKDPLAQTLKVNATGPRATSVESPIPHILDVLRPLFSIFLLLQSRRSTVLNVLSLLLPLPIHLLLQITSLAKILRLDPFEVPWEGEGIRRHLRHRWLLQRPLRRNDGRVGCLRCRGHLILVGVPDAALRRTPPTSGGVCSRRQTPPAAQLRVHGRHFRGTPPAASRRVPACSTQIARLPHERGVAPSVAPM